MRRRILILLFTLLSIVTGYSSANAHMSDLHWSKDGSRFWFYTIERDGSKVFSVGNVASQAVTSAFDAERLAVEFSRALGEKIESSTLPIETIEFTQTERRLLLRGRKTNWHLDLDSYELIRQSKTESTDVPRVLFLPSRNSERSDESTQIFVKNELASPVELVWISTKGTERHYGSISPGQTRQQHTFVGHVWIIKTKAGRSLGCFEAKSGEKIVINDEALKHVNRKVQSVQKTEAQPSPQANRSSRSPDGKWKAFIKDHNLWIKTGETEKQLSTDGSEGNSFARTGSDQPDVRWSADSSTLVAFQTTTVSQREIVIIDSSPDDQLQPKLVSHSYAKPGDELPQQSIHVFKIPQLTGFKVSSELFSNPWSLRFIEWSDSGDRFYLHYNQRGHQLVRVLEVIASDGQVRSIIEETSSTFIHYSTAGKSVFEKLDDDQLLWASERSGWNHLYRYSRSTGEVLNAVTSGEWNVKRILKVDRDHQQVWFFSVGVIPGQDPYHEHLCRANFDGTAFKTLTAGDGTHKVKFEQGGKYFVDTYSRVDLAPVSELRDSETGELICEISRENAAEDFKTRRLTERFVARGRDGETDIWGVIHWPEDFDATQTYPVVERIYAGPHDHHVPKSYQVHYRDQHRTADAGMIVVQIDGMGTAWRSKAFHDVCYKNLRDAGFPDRIAWIKAAAEKYPSMDISRVGIYGGSAGGQNAMAALLWHNDFYKVAVADCGCHDNRMDKIWWNEQWMGWPVDESYAANSNRENAHLLEGKLMLIVGELDRNVDPASTTQVVGQLIKHNKDFEFVLVVGAGHGSAETPWGAKKRLNFLKQHLLKQQVGSE